MSKEMRSIGWTGRVLARALWVVAGKGDAERARDIVGETPSIPRPETKLPTREPCL